MSNDNLQHSVVILLEMSFIIRTLNRNSNSSAVKFKIGVAGILNNAMSAEYSFRH